MAQLVLTAATSAIGAVARAGLGAVVARTVAGAAATYASAAIDRLIFGPRKRKVTGPRLESFSVQASTEGAPILRVWGRARVSGQLIWATNFKEITQTTTENSGGKGGGASATQTSYTEYLYSASFAIGLCEGVIDRVGRVWADGKPFDLSRVNARVYRGDEDQLPDDLISAVEGAAPAFRGLAYIVFEDLPLKDFGNRIPQLSFEIEKSLRADAPEALENALTAVTLIPGSGEFVYGTSRVIQDDGEGRSFAENAHNSGGVTDLVAALDNLTDAAPNLSAASLVVSWFGDSLDAGACKLRPGVETQEKATTPYQWRAGGVDRTGAYLISTLNGAPAYGGTPADRAVIEAIQNMKARGLDVMFHPFILMDAPGFPWRGRIDAATPATASADVAAFFGSAAPSDFSIATGEVVYSGPNEWSFRRFILHYAHLAKLAGGVEAYLLASELVALTTSRDTSGGYPAVAAMKALAADVRAILGPSTKISYGADWSEYSGHQPGGGEKIFHLDPLWGDPNIDFVGVDNYLPLADWRDGVDHLDALETDSIYDPDYLKTNIQSGERFDWYYASDADRAAQLRTPITDGAYGEPWVWRAKDFHSWWSNTHHDRPGGVRNASSTDWVPMSKPIRFTELGCPAIDKGANQPNVFVDAKSTESAIPHFSNGARDDLMQRRFLEAYLSFWNDASYNPISSVYGGPMVDASRAYVYAWDARPYPFFPARGDVWGDAENWERGHWLSGRLGRAPLDSLISALAAEAESQVDAGRLNGVIAGYVLDRPMSAREAIDPLMDVFQFDMAETASGLKFFPRDRGAVATFATPSLVQGKEESFTARLAQADDAPGAFRLIYLDEGADYAPAAAEAKSPGRDEVRVAGAELAAVMGSAEAEARARAILADAHVMRETMSFALPPSQLALEPGDVVDVIFGDVARTLRITDISDAAARSIDAVRTAPAVYDAPPGATVFTAPEAASVYAAPVWSFLDLPLLSSDDDGAPRFAAFSEPWAGAALYRDQTFAASAASRAIMGKLDEDLAPGFSGRWDERTIRIRLYYGSLASRTRDNVLAGANALAVETPAGWEVLQFADAQLQPDGAWALAGLLRGQGGTEAMAAVGASEGARVILLNASLTRISVGPELRTLALDWRAGPIDAPLTDGDAFRTQTIAWTNRAATPLSPVHARVEVVAGARRVSWIRRTRTGGDGWVGEDVPLGELSERYRVDIVVNGNVVRTEETTSPVFDYEDTMAATDGAPLAGAGDIIFRIAQLSDAVGPGDWAEVEG